VKLHIYNKTLDPSIWNENLTIKPEIREHLLKIAEDFYKSTGLTGEVQNILFLGSSANYNWTPTSDMDLHIVIDIASEKINEEYARKFMDSLSFKWNSDHDVEIKGHPVEVYLQDLREPNSNANQARKGTSIYSIFDDKWLVKPKREPPVIDAEKIRQKFKTIEAKADKLVDSKDIEKLKELMKSIRNYRDAGLYKDGEFSVENLVFKVLRRSGLLQKIKDTINTVYDNAMSLPENGNMQPSGDTPEFPIKEAIQGDNKIEYYILGFLTKDTLDETTMFVMEFWANKVMVYTAGFAIGTSHGKNPFITTALIAEKGNVNPEMKDRIVDIFDNIIGNLSFDTIKDTSYLHKKLLFEYTKGE
jgi:predicted nucleotidyltransferase